MECSIYHHRDIMFIKHMEKWKNGDIINQWNINYNGMFHISPLLGILWGCQWNFHLILIDYTPNKNQQILRSINNGMFNKILKITIHGDILDVKEHNEK